MASFPLLKTGAIAQYPSDRTRQFSTQVFRFLDGSEQRFPAFAAALRQWTIRLDLLDEAELETLQEFFLSEEGCAGTFSFTDPWDSTVYANCSFGSDALALAFEGPMKGTTQVTVKENR
jgi:phage-related protein